MSRGVVTLIARREIETRLQQRGFRIGFAFALLIVVAACIVPSFFSDDGSRTSYDIGIATDARGLSAALTTVGEARDARVTVHTASPEQARAKVADGDWDAAVLPGDQLVAQKSGDSVVPVVQSAYQLSQTLNRLADAGLSTAQARQALQVAPLTVKATESADNSQRQTIAIITIVVLFTQLATFTTWVAMGVVEEKASRVVELILSSVRPLQLLAGKLIGIGTLAAAQVLVIGAAALTAGTLAGTITIPVSAFATVAVSFVGFLLAFAFFAALAAALASTVSRQEEVSGVLTPVTLSLTVCYLAGFATASSPDSGLTRVLSIVPPVSALAMPGRIAHGGVPVLDVVLAVVLLLAVTVVVIGVAARIYRASILHSGSRVKLRTAWRGEAVADIA